jgi:type I restriction enzyme S subunit
MSEANGQELPHGWVRTELSAIAQINPPLDRSILNDSIAVDFVPMRAVEPEGGGLLRPEVSTYGAVKRGYTAFIPGDIIMAKITPCMENGKTCVVPALPGAACFGSTEFHVVRAEKDIEARWIANFLLQHSTRHMAQRQMMGGVGQMRVPSAFLESLKVPIPPAAEQQRILENTDELLSELDAGVAALERVQAKLKLYRAAVLKAAVEGVLSADWRAKHPATEPAAAVLAHILAERRRHWEEAQLKKFKEADKAPAKDWKAKYAEPVTPDTMSLPTLPADWCWVSLDQLCSEVRNGYSIKPNADSGVPILRISSVRPLALNLDDMRYLTGNAEDYASHLIKQDDLLFTRYNGTPSLVGVCAVVPTITHEIVHPDKVIRCRMLADLGRPHYVAIASNTGPSRKFLAKRIRTTAGQAGVSGSDIKETPIPFPPTSEQEAIVEIVEEQLSLIEHIDADLAAKLKSAQALRQSILRHAFSGRLVAQNPKDEPAADLLKRIARQREELTRLAQAAKQAKAKPQAPQKRTAKKIGTKRHS